MDTCFPLLKLKHHCEQQERERSTRGRAARDSECPLLARRRGDRGRAEVGPALRRALESPAARSPRRPSSPCLPPGSSTRWREEDPHLRVALSSVLSFFFSFIERGLRFIRNNSHFCAEQAPYSCAWRAPPRRGFCPCRLRPRSHAACVLEGFHLKKMRCLGFSVCFLKIISKEY